MISKTFRSPRQEQTCVNAVKWWCPGQLWWSYPWNRDQVRFLPVLLSVTELFLSLTPTILSWLDIRAVRKIALWMQITDLKEADSGYEDCLQEDREIWWAGDFNSGGTSNIREEGACHLKREQNEIIKWGDVCLCVATHLAAWYRLLLENAWDHFNTSLKWNLRWRAAKWTWQEKFFQRVTFYKFQSL